MLFSEYRKKHTNWEINLSFQETGYKVNDMSAEQINTIQFRAMSTSSTFSNYILKLFEVFDGNSCCSFGNMKLVFGYSLHYSDVISVIRMKK